MESVEAEGRSIDDAIERALQRLGVTRDKVDIEIVSNSPRGLFGLGGRRATVRATLRRPLALAAAQPPSCRAAPSSAARVTAGVSSAALGAPFNVQERRAAPTAGAGGGADSSSDRARTVLAEIIRLTGSEGTVELADDPGGVRLVISGDSSGVLIGRHGQTLDALEYVLNRIIAHEDESSCRLIVDLQDYRLRRQQVLEDLAGRAAERARRRGKPVALDPMSPRDRRIVHLALRNDPALTTRSTGTGFYRKVIIVPGGDRRPSRPRAAE